VDHRLHPWPVQLVLRVAQALGYYRCKDYGGALGVPVGRFPESQAQLALVLLQVLVPEREV